jgi:imidazolonepropionase-like amidohydrolase
MLINTGQEIFPDRKLGVVAPGSEVHLLMLDNDPLKDFQHITNTSLRIKNGRILNQD